MGTSHCSVRPVCSLLEEIRSGPGWYFHPKHSHLQPHLWNKIASLITCIYTSICFSLIPSPFFSYFLPIWPHIFTPLRSSKCCLGFHHLDEDDHNLIPENAVCWVMGGNDYLQGRSWSFVLQNTFCCHWDLIVVSSHILNSYTNIDRINF